MSKRKTKRQLNKLQRKEKDRRAMRVAELQRRIPPRVQNGLYDAQCLIEEGDFREAEEILTQLGGLQSKHPDVLKMLFYSYSSRGDLFAAYRVSERLCQVLPNNLDARVSRVTIKLSLQMYVSGIRDYRYIVAKWPHSPLVQDMSSQVGELERHIHSIFEGLGLDVNNTNHEKLLACFEESRCAVESGNFEVAKSKCLETIAIDRTFMPGRNNLAITYFHSGEEQMALETLRESRAIDPSNAFARNQYALLSFLMGDEETAKRLAGELLADSVVDNVDAAIVGLEVLALLGRDQDILPFAARIESNELNDRQSLFLNHYKAYAYCRAGQISKAKKFWTKASQLPEAADNLRALAESDEPHPWPTPIGKWIPRPTLKKLAESLGESPKGIAELYPHLVKLVPVFLDRGCPEGRQFAFFLATLIASDSLLADLKKFCLEKPGTLEMKLNAINTLQ
jgi:tetratricopeptide (TPR) repeat protein